MAEKRKSLVRKVFRQNKPRDRDHAAYFLELAPEVIPEFSLEGFEMGEAGRPPKTTKKSKSK